MKKIRVKSCTGDLSSSHARHTNVGNIVAKHARKFNKTAVFINRKKALKKGALKHKGHSTGQRPVLIALF
ncbi:DUF7230 family protein [Neptunomonas antarctica]|uniref:Uncharacterized protein n=1 Tax=Neptunomonas antarctica TaxID=619304 RepID=A0A1N7NFH0_9GAMM|nr:hypothetical protein SAMN05421760_10988 [Neptunomonas antarctica]